MAFWTIDQDDAKLSGLRAYRGIAHVLITRDNETVFRGLWGEWDAMGTDVIFYAYGYAGLLYSLLTDWNSSWTNQQIDTIVSDLWTRAKTTLTYSPVGFVTTGTIQAPVTTSGGSTAIVMPLYRVFYKRILFALRELSELGTSDNTNVVYFEFANSLDPAVSTVTFNFWKNKTADRPAIMWEYPNGLVRDFSDEQVPVLRRNDLSVVGSLANNTTSRVALYNTSDISTFGRRMEPIFLAWVLDADEVSRVWVNSASPAQSGMSPTFVCSCTPIACFRPA